MNIIKCAPILVFDGDIEEMQKSTPKFEFEGGKINVSPEALSRIEDIPKVVNGIDVDSISKVLGFKITVFDGEKIYYGSKPGLRLFYLVNSFDGVEKSLIFSFGEFQPGRFVCKFEGVLEM